jgi:hypothetical protein
MAPAVCDWAAPGRGMPRRHPSAPVLPRAPHQLGRAHTASNGPGACWKPGSCAPRPSCGAGLPTRGCWLAAGAAAPICASHTPGRGGRDDGAACRCRVAPQPESSGVRGRGASYLRQCVRACSDANHIATTPVLVEPQTAHNPKAAFRLQIVSCVLSFSPLKLRVGRKGGMHAPVH